MSATMSISYSSSPQAGGIRRKHFSRFEYHWLNENGLFHEGRRYELFNGDVLEQMPQNEPHGTLVMRLLFALAAAFGSEFIRCQMPIVLSDDTEPEPDIAVMEKPGREVIASGEVPPATDIRLVVEVSVSTLEFDAGAKAIRYAQAGIREYWVLDVAGRALIVHRVPTGDGYDTLTRLAETDTVSPLAAPQAVLNIVDFLP
jgi:Uma2 family endonuclease